MYYCADDDKKAFHHSEQSKVYDLGSFYGLLKTQARCGGSLTLKYAYAESSVGGT